MTAGDADAEEEASVISGMSGHRLNSDTLGDVSSEQRADASPSETAPVSAHAETTQAELPASSLAKRGQLQLAIESVPAGSCSPEGSQPLSCQTDDSFLGPAAPSPEAAAAEAVDGPGQTSAAELAGGPACPPDGQQLSQQPLLQRQRQHRQQQRQPTQAPAGPAVEVQRPPAEDDPEGAAFREWLAKASAFRMSCQRAGSCTAPHALPRTALRIIQENEGSLEGLEEQRWIMTARAGRGVLSCLAEHAAAPATAHIASRYLLQDVPWTLRRSSKLYSYALGNNVLSRRPCRMARTYPFRSVVHKVPSSQGGRGHMLICASALHCTYFRAVVQRPFQTSCDSACLSCSWRVFANMADLPAGAPAPLDWDAARQQRTFCRYVRRCCLRDAMISSRSICAMRASLQRSWAAAASAIEAAAAAAAAAASAAADGPDAHPEFEAVEGATLAHNLPLRRCELWTAPECWVDEGLQRMQLLRVD